MTPRAVVLDVFVRALYPVLLVGSVWLLLRGHDEPGGGFIGGMVAVAASALYAVARGSAAAERRIPFGPVRLAAAGVLLSLASGLPGLALGAAYMTHLWWTVPLGFTEYELSTVLAFDVGVYAAVWGGLGGLCARMIALDEEVHEELRVAQDAGVAAIAPGRSPAAPAAGTAGARPSDAPPRGGSSGGAA